MTSSHVTSFGGYKNRILDSTTTYEKYLFSPFLVWAILVWEYWNPQKICNKKVTTRLWYAAGPYLHTFGGIDPRAKALGPILPKVCQYGPLAYHNRVITYKYQPRYEPMELTTTVSLVLLFKLLVSNTWLRLPELLICIRSIIIRLLWTIRYIST